MGQVVLWLADNQVGYSAILERVFVRCENDVTMAWKIDKKVYIVLCIVSFLGTNNESRRIVLVR